MKHLSIFLIVFCIMMTFVSCDSEESSSTEPPDDNNGDEIIVPEPGTTFWWNETVFYEIFVRSFYDTDGDGIGDFQGIIEKLDYLNDGNPDTDDDLGITGIWLMPITESPSYHGYDVIDYKTIEEDYGTNETFLQFIQEAHNRGIKVIVDYVMNHTSDQHPWFINSASSEDARFRNWYRWSETDPGHTQPWGSYPAWHYKNGYYYYGVFWGGMPDLNYDEPAVVDTIMDIAKFWLEDMGVDGFRCDAVKYIDEDGAVLENTPETYQFWRDFHTYYKSINPDAMAVGEAWDASSVISEYADEEFDFCFEFEIANSILNAVNYSDPSYISSQMELVKDLYAYHQYAPFLTNHDQNRVMNQLQDNFDKAKLAGSIYLTLPGVPFIYYGEEVGMTGQKPDEDIRKPMQWNSSQHAGFTSGTPWRAVNSNYTTRNVENYQDDPNSIWWRYRDLIKVRTHHPAITKGTYQNVGTSTPDILSYLRYYEGDAVVVAANFSTSEKNSVTLELKGSNIEPGTHTVKELLSDEEIGEITIDENGGFSEWIPKDKMDSRETYIFHIEAIE